MLISSLANSQTMYNGKVTDSMQQPLSGVIVELRVLNSSFIKAYTLTDNVGLFSFICATTPDSLVVTFRKIGYVSFNCSVSQLKTDPHIQLMTQTYRELKPVIIQAPPFVQVGDTLKFSVSAYDRKDFKSIGDVIRNIPGMEISENGTVSYLGKPISNYYIDELDLLEGRYPLANEYLPKEMVEQVHIYLRHQPIKMLDSLLKTKNTALNLKLKENARGKLISSFESKLGANRNQFLYHQNFLNTFFSKGFQMLLNTNLNNTGNDQEDILMAVNLQQLDELSTVFFKTNWADVVQQQPLGIEKERFLFNNSFFPSVNTLKKHGTDGVFKFNANFINQFAGSRQTQESRFLFPGAEILLEEQNVLNTNRNIVKSGISYTLNGKKTYFKTDAVYIGYLNSFSTAQLTGTIQNIQRATIPESRIQLKSKFLKTWKKTILSGGVLAMINNTNQELRVAPGIFPEFINESNPYNEFIQKMMHHQAHIKGFLNGIKQIGRFTLKAGLELDWKKEQHVRNIRLLKDQLPETSNIFPDAQLKSKSIHLTGNISLHYKKGRWLYKIESPLGFTQFSLSTGSATVTNQLNYVNPAFEISYKFTDFQFAEAGVRRETNWEDISSRIPFLYFINYRFTKTGQFFEIPISKRTIAHFGYSTTNPETGFQVAGSYQIRHESYNTIHEIIPNTILLTQTIKIY